MSKVFFIADLHFGHKNLLMYRDCFKSIEEHDETIIVNWNKVVTKKKYIVWLLGDVCLRNNAYDMKSILDRLNGTKRIITGNHCHLDYYPRELLWNGLWKKYGYWISHAPIHPDELRGKRNIHGHSHKKSIADKRYINVCCEVINYTPVSLEQVAEM